MLKEVEDFGSGTFGWTVTDIKSDCLALGGNAIRLTAMKQWQDISARQINKFFLHICMS